AVVLAAAEALPPDSVDRIVLLAPAVSSAYDLRPALACARGGVDVFYSARDWAFLGLGVELLGTADGCPGDAAGRVGFCPAAAGRPGAAAGGAGCCAAAAGPADAALDARLRPPPWDPGRAWTGSRGGHSGCYQPVFPRPNVLPLLVTR